MKLHRPALSASLILIAMAGCAAAPSAPTARTESPAAVTPPPSVAATAATAAEAPEAPGAGVAAPIGATGAATDDAAALAQSAHELGYTKKLFDNKTVYYCKADATIGTRLSSTKCFTEDQMAAVVQRSLANRQSVQEMEHKTMTQGGGT